MNRMKFPDACRQHIDLLHPARRVWKLRLQKCNLSYLEENILGKQREDDLPGALIPERYFSFLQTKEMALLEDILQHNQEDIASLPYILQKLLDVHETPLHEKNDEDIFSVGKVYDRRGKTENARMCYRAVCRGKMSVLAYSRLGDSLRKSGDYAGAAEAYEHASCQCPQSISLHIALAKLYEHHLKSLPDALRHTREALIRGSETENMDLSAIQKRYERLLQKSRRK